MTLVWRPGILYDADALAYMELVKAADAAAGQTGGLEPGVVDAINDFVVGCKTDGIWSAIKASCILAGARTLNGALIPLAGTAPTNVNFVSGDYNRETGLAGDANTKYLNSNRALNADPLNSIHLSVYVSTAANSGVGLIGNDDVSANTGESAIYRNGINLNGRLRTPNTFSTSAAPTTVGLIAVSRSTNASIDFRAGGSTTLITTYASAGSASSSQNIAVFSRDLANAASRSNPRLAFYSIGESIDLAKLDTRVSALITAIGAAIP